MNPDPIAVRVALSRGRHLAAKRPAPEIRVEYLNAGAISAVALAKMLEAMTGFLVNFRFRPALDGPPTTIAWEARSIAAGRRRSRRAAARPFP